MLANSYRRCLTSHLGTFALRTQAIRGGTTDATHKNDATQ